MSKRFAIAMLAAIGIPPLPARTLPDAMPLEDGQTVERRVSRGDDHRYFVAAAAAECVHVIVEQRGVDVVVETRDRAGNPIAEINDEVRPNGEEHVDLVAGAAGVYSLAVKASPAANPSGGYTIRIA